MPYIATFQGDGYAVAAVAGLSANTPIDHEFPGLARTRSTVTPAAITTPDDKPPYPSVEVPDDTRSMRVVDSAGAGLDGRGGGLPPEGVAEAGSRPTATEGAA